jgi:hypothetical protein
LTLGIDDFHEPIYVEQDYFVDNDY